MCKGTSNDCSCGYNEMIQIMLNASPLYQPLVNAFHISVTKLLTVHSYNGSGPSLLKIRNDDPSLVIMKADLFVLRIIKDYPSIFKMDQTLSVLGLKKGWRLIWLGVEESLKINLAEG